MSAHLHIDPAGGVAGDMLLAALLDAGASLDYVQAGLDTLNVDGLTLEVESTRRLGLAASRVTIVAPEQAHSRDWEAVRALLDGGGLAPRALARAHATFRLLAEAEARVHGVPPERVHFHEVGALDSIGDVCGVALALEDLAIDHVTCSALPMPSGGEVRTQHGRVPLPAPATVALLQGVPVRGVPARVELVTPTGAALVAALCEGYGPLPEMTLSGVGCGAGSRDCADRANIVRVLLGIPAEGAAARRAAVELACNLDDLTPELVPDAAAACVEAGALDVWVTPVQMKKGRPGLVLSALARHEREPAVAAAMLRSTSTLGVRAVPVTRYELEREHRHVEVDGQRIAIKLGRLDGQVVNVAPEHDDVARAASALGRPVKAVWATAFAAAQEMAAR